MYFQVYTPGLFVVKVGTFIQVGPDPQSGQVKQKSTGMMQEAVGNELVVNINGQERQGRYPASTIEP